MKKFIQKIKTTLPFLAVQLYFFTASGIQTVYASNANGDSGGDVPASGSSIWTVISNFMYSVYKEILGISTVAEVVASSIALK